MSLWRRWSQLTAGLSTAARKRAMTNQPTKVLHLPEQEERAKHHRRSQEGYGNRAHHLRRRGACPPSILAGHGRIRFRRGVVSDFG